MMPSLLVHAALASLSFTLLFIAKSILRTLAARVQLRHVPGPRSSSIIWGEDWNVYHSAPGSHYLTWHQKFGKVVKFTGSFRRPILSITDERAVAFIIGSAGIYRFPKPDGVRVWFQKTLGEGILYVEGKEAHEKQRRSLAPGLSQQSVRNFTSIFHDTSEKLATQWGKLVDNSPSDETEIEVTNWAGRFALDTVARAAFSYDFNLLSGEPNALIEALDGLTNNEHKASSFYMRALFWIFPGILSIGKKGEMIRRTKVELGDISRKMWRDAKVAQDADSVSAKTVLSLMLKAGPSLHEDEIVAQMRTILSAGYETVSAAVAWVLYELAVNPTLQEQLRAEVSRLGDSTLHELNSRYPILDSVILETLRLYPPILENHHQASETISVPLSEPIRGTSVSQLVIPKGTILFIPVNMLHMDPEIWGEDAHLFRPQRWQTSDTKRKLFAFSEGPRSCIGERFAMAEIKALTVTLIQQFSFSCRHEIEPFQSFVIRPRLKGQAVSSLPLVVRRV